MHIAISIVGAILAIFVIVILHELGHFLVARAFGIRVLKFSIGFGRALYKRVGRDGTEYVLALIPLGGYVKMLGEEPQASTSAPDAYANKPVWVRMLVVAAGPVTNFVLAFAIFWLVCLIGVSHIKPVIGEVLPKSFAAAAKLQPGDQILRVGDQPTMDWQQVMIALLADIGNPRPLTVYVKPARSLQTVQKSLDLTDWRIDKRDPALFESVGILPYLPPVVPIISRVVPESPAAKAGMRAGDKILRINQRDVKDWSQVAQLIMKSPKQLLQLELARAQGLVELSVTLSAQQREGATVGYLGVMVKPPTFPAEMIAIERYTPWAAIKPAWQRTWLFFEYNAIVLAKMITAKLSVKTMGGPISIFQAAGQSTQGGWVVYLSFIAFISLTVGFINLLPIPGLDGGHLLFQLIEAISRRPVPVRIQQYGLTFGLLFVILLIVHATINDLIRLFS